MKIKLLFFVLSLLATGMLSAQESTEIPNPSGYAIETLTYEDLDRLYTLYVPSSYDEAQPSPLLVLLHGSGGQGYPMIAGTGLPEQAEETGYILVAPDGIEGVWRYLDIYVEEDGVDRDVVALAQVVDDALAGCVELRGHDQELVAGVQLLGRPLAKLLGKALLESDALVLALEDLGNLVP